SADGRWRARARGRPEFGSTGVVRPFRFTVAAEFRGGRPRHRRAGTAPRSAVARRDAAGHPPGPSEGPADRGHALAQGLRLGDVIPAAFPRVRSRPPGQGMAAAAERRVGDRMTVAAHLGSMFAAAPIVLWVEDGL